MRLIDADALLTERKKSKYYHLPNGDIAIPIIDVENAPTVKPKPQWIPVERELPEDLAEVNVTWVNHESKSVYRLGFSEWLFGLFDD